jgi:hypothetical protein
MTVAEFRASDGSGFSGALLALWWDAKGSGRRRMRWRRRLRGRMGVGCMLICIARRVLWGMRLTGTGKRDGKWRLEI